MIRHHEIRSDQSGISVVARVSLPCEPWAEDRRLSAEKLSQQRETQQRNMENRRQRTERREKIRQLAAMGATRAKVMRLMPNLTNNTLDSDLRALNIKLADRGDAVRAEILAIIRGHGEADAATIQAATGRCRENVLRWCKILTTEGVLSKRVEAGNRYVFSLATRKP